MDLGVMEQRSNLHSPYFQNWNFITRCCLVSYLGPLPFFGERQEEVLLLCKGYSQCILNVTDMVNDRVQLFEQLLIHYSMIENSEAKNVYTYLPTPPLGQDMTQGQFLSGV